MNFGRLVYYKGVDRAIEAVQLARLARENVQLDEMLFASGPHGP